MLNSHLWEDCHCLPFQIVSVVYYLPLIDLRGVSRLILHTQRYKLCNNCSLLPLLPKMKCCFFSLKRYHEFKWQREQAFEACCTGCPKKTHFQNAAGATVHWLNHDLTAPLVSGDWFLGRFLLRLSRIKRPQVMSMVKFSPIALNFGYDFVLLVHFLGHPVCFGL